MVDKNEFEELDVNNDEAPVNEFSPVPGKQDDMISSGSAGMVYDWQKAPSGLKAPPRENLDGKTVVLKNADIILPPMYKPWHKTRKGDKEYKYCSFILYYDINGQMEYISGVRVFNKDGKYSHPTITRDRVTQASQLLGLYADFKGKDINEVSLQEFLSYLHSKPKVMIKSIEVENPITKEKVKKNLIGQFVK